MQQRAEAQIQAMEWTCRALSQLRVYLDTRDKPRDLQQHPGAPENDPLEHVYRLEVTLALSRWEALLAQEEERAAGRLTVSPRERGDPALYSEKESTGFPLARE